MKILVTGGCGFIGSNFILNQITTKNNTILNFDKLTYAGNKDNLLSIENHQNYQFINGDICNQSVVNNIFNNFKPDALINFAAESHVDRSIDNPFDFINTNILGTTVLLDCSKKYYKSKNQDFLFLHISTDEVFGALDDEGSFNENSPYAPNSPYSASKAGSDHLVRSWHKTYDLPTITTHCSNNYGPYQFLEKLIPLTITNCLDEKLIPVYGDGLNVRDWIFVEDHCEAINTVLTKGQIGETYNIGGDSELTNIEIVKLICNTLDLNHPRVNGQSYNELIKFVKDRPGHDFRYAINFLKIKNNLGWKPRVTFKTGIDKTISWYLKNEDWCKKIQKTYSTKERLGLIDT